MEDRICTSGRTNRNDELDESAIPDPEAKDTSAEDVPQAD
jgi:hypothetical protein